MIKKNLPLRNTPLSRHHCNDVNFKLKPPGIELKLHLIKSRGIYKQQNHREYRNLIKLFKIKTKMKNVVDVISIYFASKSIGINP